jgi:deoxyribodipyrimidine photo-lyase
MNISYAALLEQVKSYQPGKYHSTRNYINGAVTSWAPYISRGFLSPVLVLEQLKEQHSYQEWIGFMQQMAWREYFQRVWQHQGDLILQDLKSAQIDVILEQLPAPIHNANTGIMALDNAIHQLYDTGYLHNHLRMYLSMLHSNIFKAAWLPGAKWMYAHLLDHDPAANFLSWQWVAGTFSSKKYIANQDNINKYTNTKQDGSFLDTEYENLTESIFNTAGQIKPNHVGKWPAPLDQNFDIDTNTILKNIKEKNQIQIFEINQVLPNQSFCIYNSFNLDPLWHADAPVNRILLLEPKHLNLFPITEKVLQFVIDLAKTNIPGIQIFIGNFEDLNQVLQTNSITANASVEDTQSEKSKPVIYFKEHPTTKHYQGIREERDWLFPQVDGYFPSFFGYWKKCEKLLK